MTIEEVLSRLGPEWKRIGYSGRYEGKAALWERVDQDDETILSEVCLYLDGEVEIPCGVDLLTAEDVAAINAAWALAQEIRGEKQ